MSNYCFHCGHDTVIWDNDFTYADMGLMGEGFVHVLHCANCGAEIHVLIPDEEDDE